MPRLASLIQRQTTRLTPLYLWLGVQGHELYTNLCMKAVNQSIGRAVRHQNDYAALILLDRRYGRPEIKQRLPGWIRKEVSVADRFGGLIKQTAAFFKDRKTAAS